MTNATPAFEEQPKLFGHPAGLFTLFFAEMWERFSYYGMRALLALYMVKGFLNCDDTESLTIYGAYSALVYMTPFLGGMLADKLLGQRRAVILGGILMSLGHLTMTIENELVFFIALGFIIVGNGFFKPNISTMVGQLYRPGDASRQSGFTIFYMGINLGAALSPLLCGYVGETYGWHYGFGLATIGMLIGLAVFWAPTALAQILIGGGAIATAGLMIYTQSDKSWVLLTLYSSVSIALLISAGVACVALAKGGLPDHVGREPDTARLSEKSAIGLPKAAAVYVGAFLGVPLLAALVGLSRNVRLIPESITGAWTESDNGFLNVAGEIAGSISTPAGLVLTLAGVIALVYLVRQTFTLEMIERHRMYVAMILIFFCMLFFAFFEQAGGSMSLFTDRNVARVIPDRQVTSADVGQTIEFRTPLASEEDGLKDLPPLTQEQLGVPLTSEATRAKIATAARLFTAAQPDVTAEAFPEKLAEVETLIASLGRQEDVTLTAVDKLRAAVNQSEAPANFALAGFEGSWEDARALVETIDLTITEKHVELGMGVGGDEIPASTFQSVNAIFILIFGLVFAWLWGFLRARNFEPNTAIKFALGLAQLGLGFLALWYGAENADSRGMVSVAWLLLAYMLHTTGELCLSPVGLSMITEMSPKRLVSTMMGAWFLATAFSNYLAAIIGTFTSPAKEGGAEVTGEQVVPPPIETLDQYGLVFMNLGIAGLVAAGSCLLLSPLLKKWMHLDAPPNE